MGDKTKGMYYKFNVTRTDGTSKEGEKHDGCQYFVLDLDHDAFALPTLQVYADLCRSEYPLLAADLDELIAKRK